MGDDNRTARLMLYRGTVERELRKVLGLVVTDLAQPIDELHDTPTRWTSALLEMTAGYRENPAELLAKRFACDSQEIVALTGVQFASLCEHHLLPFEGEADVAYLPAGAHVVGLSKLARLVECYARRLQLQERMTRQVAQALVEHGGAQGAACRVRATHSCMSCRGIRRHATMVTSSMLGSFRADTGQRLEVLAIFDGKEAR